MHCIHYMYIVRIICTSSSCNIVFIHVDWTILWQWAGVGITYSRSWTEKYWIVVVVYNKHIVNIVKIVNIVNNVNIVELYNIEEYCQRCSGRLLFLPLWPGRPGLTPPWWRWWRSWCQDTRESAYENKNLWKDPPCLLPVFTRWQSQIKLS